MGYFSRLAVELLEINRDREQEIDRTPDQPVIQQEEQFSLWNEQYRKQLEQSSKKSQPKVYKKTRGSK